MGLEFTVFAHGMTSLRVLRKALRTEPQIWDRLNYDQYLALKGADLVPAEIDERNARTWARFRALVQDTSALSASDFAYLMDRYTLSRAESALEIWDQAEAEIRRLLQPGTFNGDLWYILNYPDGPLRDAAIERVVPQIPSRVTGFPIPAYAPGAYQFESQWSQAVREILRTEWRQEKMELPRRVLEVHILEPFSRKLIKCMLDFYMLSEYQRQTTDSSISTLAPQASVTADPHDSGHYAIPKEKRLAAVTAYRRAQARGEVTNRDAWARKNIRVCGRTLGNWLKEFANVET